MRLHILILLVACLCVLWTQWTLRVPRKGDCLRPEVHENFLTPAECTEIIERAKELGLDRSAVTSTADGSGTIDASRTSTQVFLPDDDPVAHRLAAKVASFLRVPPNRMEQIQVLHYGPGQKYEPTAATPVPIFRESPRSSSISTTSRRAGKPPSPCSGLGLPPRPGGRVTGITSIRGRASTCRVHCTVEAR
jgi:hypothetical protein